MRECLDEPREGLVFARYPDAVLRRVAAPVVEFDAALAACVRRMRETARGVGAVGLAATQCGVDARLVLLGDRVFVNPVIAERSDESRMRPRAAAEFPCVS